MTDNNLQQLSNTFFAVLLSYIITDSITQTKAWFGDSRRPAAYLLRGLVHLGITMLSLALFARSVFEPSFRLLWVLVYLAVNAVIDRISRTTNGARPSDGGAWPFAIKQFLHICAVLALVVLVVGVSPQTVARANEFFNSIGSKALSAITIYAGTVFAGGYLIRRLTRPLADQIHEPHREQIGLENAGMYIGWLERWLIVTAVLMQSPAIVGLIVAGKSIARFPEMNDPRFAEYFLIGTFLSVALAIAGGMLIQLIWNGAVQFK